MIDITYYEQVMIIKGNLSLPIPSLRLGTFDFWLKPRVVVQIIA